MNAFRFAWVGLCLVVLAFTLSAGPNPEQGIFFAYAMLAITFPIGFVAAYLLGLVSLLLEHLFGYVIPYDLFANVATWLLFVSFGYLQWFVLVPWVLVRLRGQSANDEPAI